MYLRAESEQRGKKVSGGGGGPHQVRFSYPLVWWGPCLVLINLEWILTAHYSQQVTRLARNGSHGPYEAWSEGVSKTNLIDTSSQQGCFSKSSTFAL